MEANRKSSETKRKRLVDPLYRQKMSHKGKPNIGVSKYWQQFSGEERIQIMKNRLAKFKGVKRPSEVGRKVSATKTGSPTKEAQRKGSIEAGKKLSLKQKRLN